MSALYRLAVLADRALTVLWPAPADNHADALADAEAEIEVWEKACCPGCGHQLCCPELSTEDCVTRQRPRRPYPSGTRRREPLADWERELLDDAARGRLVDLSGRTPAASLDEIAELLARQTVLIEDIRNLLHYHETRPAGDDGVSPTPPPAGRLTPADLENAAKYVTWWSESDNCDDRPENIAHLRALSERLQEARFSLALTRQI